MAENEIEVSSEPCKKEVASDPQAVNSSNTNANSLSSPSKETAEVLKTAMQLLAAGKRNLLVCDPNAAATSLAQACELLGKHYGETAKECGEAYFFYGKALLELARLETGVIDNVLDGDESEENSVDEEEEEEEEEETAGEDDKEEEEEEEGGETAGEDKDEEDESVAGTEKKDDNGTPGQGKKEEPGPGSSATATAAAAEEDRDATTAKEDTESIGSNEAGTSNAKDNTDKTAVDQEDLEDPSNLQLAWEMLELAKNIFQKHADSLEAISQTRLDLEDKLSETYQLLGEVSIESECYKQAIEDLTICLQRRQELLPPDSRCIAETHYQLGVALGFNVQFDEAIASLNNAIDVLQCRINNLKTATESPAPNSKSDAFYNRDREIAEIESLIPEIREKIADTKDMEEETIKKLGDRRMYEEAISAGSLCDISASNHDKKLVLPGGAQTNSIAHLVKKRKKSDDDEPTSSGEAGASDAKKPHVDPAPVLEAPSMSSTTNGHRTTNGSN